MVPRSSRLVPITALVFALMVCGLVTSQEQNSGPNQPATDDTIILNFYDLKGKPPGGPAFPTTFQNRENTVKVRAFRLNKETDEQVGLLDLLDLLTSPNSRREEFDLLKLNPNDQDQTKDGKGLRTDAKKNQFRFVIPTAAILEGQERAVHFVLTREDIGDATAIISFIELVGRKHELHVAVPVKQNRPKNVPAPQVCPQLEYYYLQCAPRRFGCLRR